MTHISARRRLDRTTVKRVVDKLERAGLVTIDAKVLPGHGRMKKVCASASQFSLQAKVA